MEKKEYDFLFGVILCGIGLAVIWESINIWREVEGDFTQSPGLMPAVLGAGLAGSALLLVYQSVKSEGMAVFSKLLESFFSIFGNNSSIALSFLKMIAAVAFFTFVLMPNLPFWMSSFIFMVYTMYLAGARKLWLILLLSAFVSLAIVVVFDILFRVPLPTNPAIDAYLREIFKNFRGNP